MAQEQTKKCPFCAEEIKVEAVVCKFCSRSLLDADRRIKRATAEVEAKKKTMKQLPIVITLLVIGIILMLTGNINWIVIGGLTFFSGLIFLLVLRIRVWWHTGR
jgi:hypothetical protein